MELRCQYDVVAPARGKRFADNLLRLARAIDVGGTAHIAFDAKKPEAAKIDVEIDLASVDTGASETDTEVKKPSWFNVTAFPTAKFNATAVRQISPGNYEANEIRISTTVDPAGRGVGSIRATTLRISSFSAGVAARS